MDRAIYLQPTFLIDCADEQIIAKANELTCGCSLESDKARALFYFVRDTCSYNLHSIKSDYRASKIMEQGGGYCVQKAILLAALARAAGIPSRLGLAAIRNHKLNIEAVKTLGTNILFPHSYNQFLLNGKWVSATATFGQSDCERLGVPDVEFDGRNDAMLSPVDLTGQPYIDYLEFFGEFADLPLEIIMENLPRFYGDKFHKFLYD